MEDHAIHHKHVFELYLKIHEAVDVYVCSDCEHKGTKKELRRLRYHGFSDFVVGAVVEGVDVSNILTIEAENE